MSACTDWLTVQPETSMTAETLFQTDNGVKYGLNGAYLLASKLSMDRPDIWEDIVLWRVWPIHTFMQ